MTHPFFGRKEELELLETLWNSSKEEFLVLYGRRRVGKTALLTEWIRRTGHHALYWVATPASSVAQLRAFSQAIYNFAYPDAPAPATFTYADWDQAFRQIAQLAQNERLALFIDEFTYLLETTPEIAGIFQNAWDHLLQNTNLFLCLSGSHMGMMKREFLSYQAPLYGRATSQLFLRPFYFGSMRDFFPNYSAVDRVAIYSIFGGVPAYWEQIDSKLSVAQNIKLRLLNSNNILQSEPRLLLQDFISEPHNYLSLLGAIANGSHAVKDIASFSGLPNVQIPKYLEILINTGFVERRVPVTEKGPSRAGRYHIADPYLRFYFRFLADRQDQLALGAQDQALEEITRHMIDFIGTYTWEELCREWVLRASSQKILPFLPDQVGSAWNSKAQVDVVGINWMKKTLILGECKWKMDAVGRDVMAELVEKKADKIIPEEGNWKVYFMGFSRSSWTLGAKKYQEEINHQPVQEKNWISVGMRLIDLEEVDKNLSIGF